MDTCLCHPSQPLAFHSLHPGPLFLFLVFRMLLFHLCTFSASVHMRKIARPCARYFVRGSAQAIARMSWSCAEVSGRGTALCPNGRPHARPSAFGRTHHQAASSPCIQSPTTLSERPFCSESVTSVTPPVASTRAVLVRTSSRARIAHAPALTANHICAAFPAPAPK